MAQVERFEVKKFYRESISTAFKVDKARLAVAIVLGLGGYGLLRRLEVGRFVALTPTVLYAAYSIGRANRSEQIRAAATALARGAVQKEELPEWIRPAAIVSKEEMIQTISSLLNHPIEIGTLAGTISLSAEESFRYRAAELLSLPEGEGQGLVNQWAGADLQLDERVVRSVAGGLRIDNLKLSPLAARALLKQFGWEVSIPDSPYMSAAIDALKILHKERDNLFALQYRLGSRSIEIDRSEGLTLLNGGRAIAPFDREARNTQVRAAIAPRYDYLQVCPDGETRTRTLTQATHLKIFAWTWRNTTQKIQYSPLIRQEIDAQGVLPEIRETDLVERAEVIAFLAMKGRRRFISDEAQNLNFSLSQVALAGVILETFGEGEVIRARLPIGDQLLNAVSYWRGEELSLFDQAIGLINLGQPS